MRSLCPIILATAVLAAAAPAAQAAPLGPDSHAVKIEALRHRGPHGGVWHAPARPATIPGYAVHHSWLAKTSVPPLGPAPTQHLASARQPSGGFNWGLAAAVGALCGLALIAIGAAPSRSRTRTVVTGR